MSDRDKAFISKFWQSLFRKMGTFLAMSSSHHPELDGLTKIFNKCIEHYLHYFIAENRKTWVDLLPWTEFSYNTIFYTSIGMATFKVVYGCDPSTLMVYELDDVDPILVAEFLQQRDKVLQ